jgi:hypothetical protein
VLGCKEIYNKGIGCQNGEMTEVPQESVLRGALENIVLTYRVIKSNVSQYK